jgi:hypothetical protein
MVAPEDVTVETRRSRFEEAVSMETVPRRDYPVVVSMEEVPDPKKRHTAFHQKISIETAPTVSRGPRPRFISTPAELKHAMLMQVVLGPPKALE